MRNIGLIGGMSWESSALYYRLINQATKRRLGGHHNARCVMVSVDFAEIESAMQGGEWPRIATLLGDSARQLERAGADFIVLCTNTMHKLSDSIERATRLPLLHIIDATAAAIQRAGHRVVGLLATRFTMEQAFYIERMHTRFGIEVRVPAAPARERVHEIIFQELCHGIFRDQSRQIYRQIMAELGGAGAEAIVLGCTEIELLLSADDCPLPVYPSTALHAEAAVELALSPPP